MTTTISKYELALMMPGTLHHYFKDEAAYRVPDAPKRPGVLARIGAAVSAWTTRRADAVELAALSDAQLADIGISRADAARMLDADFAAQRGRERIIGRAQTGCVMTTA